MRGWMLCLGLIALLGSTATLTAGPIYITGPSEPWGSNSNITAMNTAFGPGNWTQNNFSNAVANGSFSTSRFVFIDGGDGNDTAFVSFLTSNITTLQNFVAGGGSLFLNAATWNFPTTFSLGFGATSNFNNYDGGAPTATAVNPGHAIFQGPNGLTGAAWNGNFFAHNYITGGGYTSLIKDGFGRDVLVGGAYGAGYIMLGGMTTPNFQGPQPQADILRANELNWGANQLNEVPVPAGVVMAGLGAGLMGCVQFVRRRRLARA